jgi:hypothetical protein
MLQVINGLALTVGQPVEHLWRELPANFPVGSHVPHRVSSLLEFAQYLSDQGLHAFGGRSGFSFLKRDVHPEFQLFRLRNFIWSSVRATESLSQISILRIGRPRHTPATSHELG